MKVLGIAFCSPQPLRSYKQSFIFTGLATKAVFLLLEILSSFVYWLDKFLLAFQFSSVFKEIAFNSALLLLFYHDNGLDS